MNKQQVHTMTSRILGPWVCDGCIQFLNRWECFRKGTFKKGKSSAGKCLDFTSKLYESRQFQGPQFRPTPHTSYALEACFQNCPPVSAICESSSTIVQPLRSEIQNWNLPKQFLQLEKPLESFSPNQPTQDGNGVVKANQTMQQLHCSFGSSPV